MPNSEALLIWPMIISPLKGRKTIRRNSTSRNQLCNFCSRTFFLTVDIHYTGAMTNKTVRCFQDVVDADAEPYFLDYLDCFISSWKSGGSLAHFVSVFGVNIVFDAFSAWLFDVFRRNLNQVGNGCLGKERVSGYSSSYTLKTY